jgi:hypothetical protein
MEKSIRFKEITGPSREKKVLITPGKIFEILFKQSHCGMERAEVFRKLRRALPDLPSTQVIDGNHIGEPRIMS